MFLVPSSLFKKYCVSLGRYYVRRRFSLMLTVDYCRHGNRTGVRCHSGTVSANGNGSDAAHFLRSGAGGGYCPAGSPLSGGLISAILIEIPETPSSIATVLDEGKAGTIYLQRVCRPARKRINVEQVRKYTAPGGCGHAPYACSVSVPLVIASLPLALMEAWEM